METTSLSYNKQIGRTEIEGDEKKEQSKHWKFVPFVYADSLPRFSCSQFNLLTEQTIENIKMKYTQLAVHAFVCSPNCMIAWNTLHSTQPCISSIVVATSLLILIMNVPNVSTEMKNYISTICVSRCVCISLYSESISCDPIHLFGWWPRYKMCAFEGSWYFN